MIIPILGTSLPGANLVANSGFENDPTVPINWTIVPQNGNTPTLDSESHNGTNSIKISIDGTIDIISGYVMSDLIPAEPFQYYNLSAWGKTQGAGGAYMPRVRVIEFDSNQNFVRQTNLPEFSETTKDWTQTRVEFQTEHDTAYLRVYANIWKGHGTFWVDDVELKQRSTGPEPSPVPTSYPAQTSIPEPTSTPSFPSPVPSETNLVLDPGFENGEGVPLNWTIVPQNENTPVLDYESHNGEKAIKITVDGTIDIISGYVMSDLIPTEPHKSYDFSAWGKTENADGTYTPRVRIVELDANKNWIIQTNLPEFSRGTNDWEQRTMQFETRSRTAYLYVYANIWKGHGTFWVDDISLTKTKPFPADTPTPTPVPVITNLASNPGFENGDSIPFNWTIVTQNGNEPTWGGESHSGRNAIKISIDGTIDAISGYVMSDLIPVEPFQSFDFSAWVKTEGVGGTRTPVVRIVEVDANEDWLRQTRLPELGRGTNDWTKKSVQFVTGSNTAYLYIDANIKKGYGTFRVDDVELKPGNVNPDNEPVPVVTSIPSPDVTYVPVPDIIATPVKPYDVGVEENNDKTISINGKKTFPVLMMGICNRGNEEPPCDVAHSADFTGDPSHSFQPWAHDTASWDALVSDFEKYGLVWGANIGASESLPVKSPNFLGYIQADEPPASAYNNLLSLYNERKSQGRRVILNHWIDMTKWIPATDIISWDTYMFRYNTNPKGWVDWKREDSVYAWEIQSERAFFKGTSVDSINKPVWAILQGNGREQPLGDTTLYVPGKKEVRANLYSAISTNIQGVGYYGYKIEGNYGLTNNEPLYAYYKQLARELKGLNDILVLPTKDYSWFSHSGTLVTLTPNPAKIVEDSSIKAFSYMLKQQGNTWYLIIVNKDSNPINNVNVAIAGLTGEMSAKTLGLETEGSEATGRTLIANNGRFTDSFDGYAVHIYQIS